MFYKLSNTATAEQLQDYFDIPLRYPRLYERNELIDGFKEANLIIRTIDSPQYLQIAIWGILPEKYTGSWQEFQRIKNTLNLNAKSLINNPCFNNSLEKRRCLILVTGFFTTYIDKGKTIPFYVYLSSGRPFCLAGVYNKLDDGFITCSVLISDRAKPIQKVQNLGSEMPLIINKRDSEKWLRQGLSQDEIEEIITSNENFLLKFHPVSDDVYRDSPDLKNILRPVVYGELNNFN